MRRPSPTPLARLIRDGLRAAKLEHIDAAEALYVSARQIGRYVAGDAVPSSVKLQLLARVVAPHDGELAAELARAGGVILEPPNVTAETPTSPDVTRVIPTARLADLVVCAVADAIDAPPRTARAAVAAAFASARDLGFTGDAILAALAPQK